MIKGRYISLFILTAIVVVFLSGLAQPQDIRDGDWTIDKTTNKVELSNEKIDMASPYTISSPGWYEYEFLNKESFGLTEIIFLVNSEDYWFSRPQIYNPTSIINSYNYTCKDKSPVIGKNHVTCYAQNKDILNDSLVVEFERNFDWYEGTTFYWNITQVNEWEDLDEFKITYLKDETFKSLTETNKEFSTTVDLTQTKSIRIRTYVGIKRIGTGFLEPKKITEEYWIFLKPVDYTYDDSIRDKLYIDPWINSTGSSAGLSSLDNGLIHYYNFDDGNASGGASIYGDEIFPQNNFSATHAESYNVSGIINGAWQSKLTSTTNSATRYILPNSTMSEDGAFSISLWTKTYTDDSNWKTVMDFRSSKQLIMYHRSSNIVYYPDGANLKTLGPAPSINTWYHVVLVYNGTYIRGYINGVSTQNLSQGIADTVETAYTHIGRGYDNSQKYNGLIDELGFWNRTLTLAEVQSLYNGGGGITYSPPGVIDYNIVSPENKTYTTPNLTFEILLTSNVLNVDYCDVNISSGTFELSCAGTNCSRNFTSLPEGSDKATFYCNDTDGNNVSKNISYTIDYSAPTMTGFLANPSSPVKFKEGQYYEFNVTVEDAISSMDTVKLNFNGANYTATNISSVYNVSFSNLSNGAYDYYWYANDSIGNQLYSETYSYRVYTPLVNLTSPVDFFNSSSENVTFMCYGSSASPNNLTLFVDGIEIYNVTNSTPIPVAYYTMNDDGANTTVFDEMRSSDGVSTQNTEDMTTTGKLSKALDFNGIDDLVLLPTSEALNITSNNSFSISLWAYVKSDPSPNRTSLISFSPGVSMEVYTGGRLSMLMKNETNTYSEEVASVYTLKEWFMATMTYDNNTNTARLYYNGVEIGDMPGLNISGTPNYNTIGGNNSLHPTGGLSNSMWFNGSIDDVRIYNQSLTSSEILSLYNEGYGAEGISVISLEHEHTFSEYGIHNWTCVIDDEITATYRNLTILERPTCYLISTTPTNVSDNSTGYWNILINCTTPRGFNISTTSGFGIAPAYDNSFITRTVDNFVLAVGVPNYFANFYPNNSLGVTGELTPGYEIWRGHGRNVGAWYDSLEYYDTLNNDTFSYSVNDGRLSGLVITNVTGDGESATEILINYTGLVQTNVFRVSYYLCQITQFANTKYNYTLTDTNLALARKFDAEAYRGFENYTIHTYVNIHNDGSTPRVLRSYYCNDSYSPDGNVKPIDSPYCVLVSSFSSTEVQSKLFTNANSSYIEETIGITNGMIGGIKTTAEYYLAFDVSGVIGATANQYMIRYLNGSSPADIDFNETNVAWASSDAGTTWNIQNYTFDIFSSSVIRENNEYLEYGVYVNDSSGATYFNDSIFGQGITPSRFPISNPTLLQYNSSETLNDTSRNGTHNRMMNIRIGVAMEPGLPGTVTHNLTLRNPDGTFYYTINESFTSPTDADMWINFNTYLVPNGSYKMRVDAYSYDGVSNKSFTTADTFTIENTNFSLILNTPINATISTNGTVNMTVNISDAMAIKNITVSVYNLTDGLVNETTTTFDSSLEIFEKTFGVVITLTDGVYHWFYSAWGWTGTLFTTSENNTLTLDTVSPFVEFHPPTDENDSYIERSEIYFNISVYSLNLKNITAELYDDTFTLLQESPISETGINVTYYGNFSGLSNGDYYIRGRACNQLGACNTSSLNLIHVDLINPGINFTDPTTSSNNLTGAYNLTAIWANITVTDTYPKNASIILEGPLGYNNQTNFLFNETTQHFYYNFTSLIDGEYNLYGIVYDQLGKSNMTENRTIHITGNPPTNFTYELPTPTSSEGIIIPLTINVSLYEPNIDRIIIRLTYPNNTVIEVNSSSYVEWFEYTFSIPDGEYRYNASAYDIMGNVAHLATQTIRKEEFPGNTSICKNLTLAGTYTLVTNLNQTGGVCLNVMSSGVTIDCAGYAISVPYGNPIFSNQVNTIIRNCTFRNSTVDVNITAGNTQIFSSVFTNSTYGITVGPGTSEVYNSTLNQTYYGIYATGNVKSKTDGVTFMDNVYGIYHENTTVTPGGASGWTTWPPSGAGNYRNTYFNGSFTKMIYLATSSYNKFDYLTSITGDNFNFTNSSYNDIRNSNLTGTKVTLLNNSIKNTFHDTYYDSETVDESSELIRTWTTKVITVDEEGDPVGEVIVYIKDGTNITTGTSPSGSTIVEVVQYINNGTVTTHNPYEVYGVLVYHDSSLFTDLQLSTIDSPTEITLTFGQQVRSTLLTRQVGLILMAIILLTGLAASTGFFIVKMRNGDSVADIWKYFFIMMMWDVIFLVFFVVLGRYTMNHFYPGS